MLTNGNSTVRTTEVGICLRYGTHAQLVIGTRQEAGKGAGKCHRAVTTGTADSNADQILLRDVAFNELLRVHCLQCTASTVNLQLSTTTVVTDRVSEAPSIHPPVCFHYNCEQRGL